MITEKDLEAATASLETALSVRAEKSQTVKQKILEVDAANAAYLKAMDEVSAATDAVFAVRAEIKVLHARLLAQPLP